jgi:hypothetical protein
MLRNPDTALLLYVMLVIVGFMFGQRWQGVRDAITTAGNSVTGKG